MTEQLEGQMSIFDVDGWCGRTSPAPCQAEPQRAKISASSSKKPQGSQIRLPLFLDLRTANGCQPDASWEMGGLLPGEYMMHSFGECPREENASRLSQILEDSVPQKYSLSEKACSGILTRAARRGKALPKELKDALERQATPSKSEGGVEVDSAGKKAGKGALVQKEKSGTLGVSQDQTLIQTYSFDHSADRYAGVAFKDVAKTLTPGTSPGCHDAVAVLWNGKADGADGEGVAFSVVGDHDNRPTDMTNIVSYALQGAVACDMYNQSITGDVAASLTASSGSAAATGPSVIIKEYAKGETKDV